MEVKEKTIRFITALADVYQDPENRELEDFQKLEIVEDMTSDMTAMLIAMHFLCENLTGYDGDLIDFTHVLNKLAVQYIMEKATDDERQENS